MENEDGKSEKFGGGSSGTSHDATYIDLFQRVSVYLYVEILFSY